MANESLIKCNLLKHLSLLCELRDVVRVDAELLEDGVLDALLLEVVLVEVADLVHVPLHGEVSLHPERGSKAASKYSPLYKSNKG